LAGIGSASKQWVEVIRLGIEADGKDIGGVGGFFIGFAGGEKEEKVGEEVYSWLYVLIRSHIF
jgi:hypothetical protein